MNEYISRIRKLGGNDYVNGETFNSIVSQLQHNIDFLYRSQASSVDNWNISELIYGNLMDYDQVGKKRFVNGGKLDSLEKTLPFSSTSGTLQFEETDILNNDYWLRWTLPEGIKENVQLVRNIVVPEALRHQTILIGAKFMPFEGNDVKINERYEIYVNGAYTGTGETDTVTINGVVEPKTIYGVYDLTGEETNLEISLVRSITNGDTPSDYTVRVSNMFVGLHTLGNSSFAMNFPISGSLFTGAASDISSFFNFEKNSVRPIPAFLLNNEMLDGGSSLSVNITSQDSTFQNEFWIGVSGTGNQLGTTYENVMLAQDFFSKDVFNSSVTTIHLQNTDEKYGDMIFDKGNYEVFLNNSFEYNDITSIQVADNSSVTFKIEENNASTRLNIDTILVKNSSQLEITSDDGANGKLRLINNGVEIGENSYLDIKTGTFSTKVSSGKNFYVHDGGKANIELNEPSFSNSAGEYGFACSLGTIYLDKYASLDISNDKADNNPNPLNFHIGVGGRDDSVTINNHSHLTISGFNTISTSSATPRFVGKLHSSIEVFDNIQADGGATAFTDVKMELFSTFGSPLSGGSLSEDLLESFVYEIEN